MTDGVGAGLFLNLNPEPAGATDGSFLFLCAPPLLALNDGVHGSELWRTDATSVGTMLLRDIKAGVEGANVECTGAYLGDRTLVAADDGVNGREFWITDGVNGAQLLKDIQPGSGSGIQNAAVTPFRDRLLFAADDGVLGQEPWVTDGTSAGTVLLDRKSVV